MGQNHDNRTGDDRPPQELQVLFSRPFLGLCGALLTLCGLVIGIWSNGIQKDLDDIRRILNERATIPPRTGELERRTDDQEQRLRAIEEKFWRNGWK